MTVYSVEIPDIFEVIFKTRFSKISKCSTLDQVSDEFRDEIGRLANLNYSDQSVKFDQIESVAHSIKKEEKKEEEKEIELDGEEMEETALVDEEEEEKESEDVEMVESKHSQELLQKVYRYLHLSVRPRLFNLINPPKNMDDETAQYDERSVRIPVAASLVELLLMLGPGVVRAHAPRNNGIKLYFRLN